MSRLHWALVLLACSGSSALAQPPKGNPLVPTWLGPVTRLDVQPAPAPDPSMKYRLLPEVRDLTPGNAAYLYQRAHAPEWWAGLRLNKQIDKIDELLEVPLSKMSRERAETTANMRYMLKEVDRAARREHCDWEWNERVREDGIALLIPDVQSFRTYGSLLAVRARLEMLDGRFQQALYTLQTNLAMSRHVADAPMLINALVGMATANMTIDQIKEFIQVPGSPNLYWALADLPKPLLDLRKPLQGERMMIDGMFPGVRQALDDPKHPPLSPEQLLAKWSTMHLAIVEHPQGRAELAYLAARAYAPGRKYLLEHGWTAEQVDAMPVTQVALMINVVEYDRHFDAMYRWHNFPHHQQRQGMRAWDVNIKKEKASNRESSLLATLLLPAVHRVTETRALVERRLAALQVVEAIRLHAAANDGALPQALTDIKEVPVPLDPWTGQPFAYQSAGNRAALYGPPLQGDPADERNTVSFEIVFRRPVPKEKE